MPSRRSLRRGLRIGSIAAASVVVVAIGVAATMLASFDPNAWKPEIAQAVRTATGRDLSLNGGIILKWSLSPTIELRDVALANPPGFSRSAMATLERLDLELALLPLLSRRIEVTRLTLTRPDILLETDANGRSNWNFAPDRRPAATMQTEPAAAPEKRAPFAFAFRDLRVQDGALAFRDGVAGRTTSIAIGKLAGRADSLEAPLHFTADIVYDGASIKISADSGSLARAFDAESVVPWPLKLALETGDAKLSVEGMLSAPLKGRGYRLAVNGVVPDLARFAPFVPDHRLPPVRDIGFDFSATDAGAAIPAISAIRIRAGRSDLSVWRPGLVLDGIDIDAPTVTQPIAVTLRGFGATVGARFTIAEATARRLDVRGLKLESPDGDLDGDIAIDFSTPPAVVARLHANRIDLDAIEARIPAAPIPASPIPAAPATVREPARVQGQIAPPAPPAAEAKRLFSDTPIRYGELQRIDLDLRIAIGALRVGEADFRALDAHIALRDGKLTVDPFSVAAPGGTLAGRLAVDATEKTPPVALVLRAPKVASKPLLAALGQPRVADGDLELYADLRAAGETPHALAASLQGPLGVAFTNGAIDNRVLGQWFGRAGDKADLLNIVARGGVNEVRCFAVGLQFDAGVGTLRALSLGSSMLTMRGGGSLDLGAETMQVKVTPQGRIGANGIVVPLKIDGPMRAPRVAIDAAGDGKGGPLAGIVIGNAAQLGAIGGDVCTGPLAIARGEQPPPETADSVAAAPSVKPPNPAALLRQLLR